MIEYRFETLSYEEAMEFCEEHNLKFVKVYQGRGNNAGKLMALSYDLNNQEKINSIKDNNNDNQKNDHVYVIYTKLSSGVMYLADKKLSSNNVTFNINLAKRFEYNKAVKKSKAMTKKGKYNWKVLRTLGR